MAILALPNFVRDGEVVRRATFWDKISFLSNAMMSGEYDMKKINYSEEMTAKIISDYQAGMPVEDIALTIDRSVRSVRSKLVREGVYQAAEKAPAKKSGPSKKELLIELEGVAPFDVAGLAGATKTSISDLIGYFKEGDS